MSLTITSFTDKILEHYPRADSIKIQVYKASMDSKYKSWTARIKSVLILNRFRRDYLTREDYLDLFGDNYIIKLGVNNNKRYIRKDAVNTILIDTVANTFFNEDGEIIKYYPNESY